MHTALLYVLTGLFVLYVPIKVWDSDALFSAIENDVAEHLLLERKCAV